MKATETSSKQIIRLILFREEQKDAFSDEAEQDFRSPPKKGSPFQPLDDSDYEEEEEKKEDLFDVLKSGAKKGFAELFSKGRKSISGKKQKQE